MVDDGSSVGRSYSQITAQVMRMVMTVVVEAASIRYQCSGKVLARPQPVSHRRGGGPVTRPGNGRRHCLSRRSDGEKIVFEIL